MLRDVLNHLDYSATAEIALMIFAATFCAVVIRTLRSSAAVANSHAAMALDEAEGDAEE